MNWDPRRRSGFSIAMKEFMERLGLVSVWEEHPVSYTHIHTDLTSTSTLDHFIVNSRLLSLIVDADVMHLGDNLSRHSPIMLKLKLGSIPVQKKTKSVAPGRPAWYKAEQNDKEDYTCMVSEKLSMLHVPEASHQCIPMSCGARQSKPECPIEKAIPGWKEMV